MVNKKIIEILLVEDNPGDIELVREAMIDSQIESNLNTVSDGDEALLYLRHEGRYKNSTRPDLVLLDLNLPKKDGREVLSEIKSDDLLRTIPVIILTTSCADEDVFTTYNLHANCFITKPVELEKFINAIRSIENFWFTTVRLPEWIDQ